jgi:predicted permease
MHTHDLWQDVRYGLRTLAASPGFTAVALLSLTLGIGVATSAYSELNGFIGRDVPGALKPGELVTMEAPIAYPDYRRYRERTDLFTGTTAYAAPVPLGVTLGGRSERIWGHLVSASYFSTLGVRPAWGSFFSSEEEQTGRSPNVVVSYRYWQNHLGSDLKALGKSLRVNGQPCTIIGIAPPEFQGASPMVYGADLWLPVSVGGRLAPELADQTLERHDRAIFHMVGRLPAGVSSSRAEAALDALARQLEQENGDPDRDQKGGRVRLLPGGKLLPIRQQDLPVVTGFMTLLGGMILLIACANVVNMTLARAMDRRKEIAIRLALGAGRARLIRQLLTESMLVAVSAGVLGFLLATWLMHLGSQEKLPTPMPLTFNFAPDARVIWFTIALTGLTGLLFGLAPALQATRPDLTPALKEGGQLRLCRHRRLNLRNLLVLSEVAGSLALLMIMGFMVIGHRSMVGLDLGFDPARLALISVDPIRDGYSGGRAADFLPKLLNRVKEMPSVAAASFADTVPMTMMGQPRVTFAAEGPGETKSIHLGTKHAVERAFFNTMGIPILRGRGFRKEDEANGSMAVIISEKLAQVCWKGEDPLGRRIELGTEGVATFSVIVNGGADRSPRLTGKTQLLEVVGVAKNVRDGLNLVAADAPPVLYLPLHPADYAQPGLLGVTLIVRGAPGADALGAARREIAAMDDGLTPFNARLMTEEIADLLFPVQVALWTYGCIGIFGLILASAGLAGVTAYSVTQRRKEIGIRVALGARSTDVLGLVMKEGAVLIGVGAILGIAGALAGIRVLSAVLAQIARTSGTSTSDPMLIVGTPLLLAALALLACYLPARQSMRIDPIESLRDE